MKTNLFSGDTKSNCNEFLILITYGKQDTQKKADGVNMVGIATCNARFSDNNNGNTSKKGYTPRVGPFGN